MRIFLLLSVVILLPLGATAQLNAQLAGDAISNGNNCYTVTPDQNNRRGGVWFTNPIDFSQNFTINFQGDFGNKDVNGADGMALVFKPNSNSILGVSGGGLGYEGIGTSLIVEFDTWQNGHLGDPVTDHIAIQSDGNPNHSSSINNLAGPVQASTTSGNIEDGNLHDLRIEWNVATTTLEIFFDCDSRITLTQDVVTTIFNNNSIQYFGFVGSTGGATNIHKVCFNGLSFVADLVLQDETICQNQVIAVDATIPSGVSYSWSPTIGVSDPNIANPLLNPTTTTTYTVSITDICGIVVTEDITITVNPPISPTFNPIPDICIGDNINPLPTTSIEGITGTWSPALNNQTTTTYTFTPNNGECANATDLTIIVTPNTTPTFNSVAAICAGDTLNPLPTTSTEGITGTWSPSLNNQSTTTYTFTPDNGQCAATTTLTIDVNPPTTPTFNPVDPICQGDSLNALPSTSLEGIPGSWSPAIDNTSTTTYTFTPTAGACANTASLTITVNNPIDPTFNVATGYCLGDTIPALPNTSNNGINGTWSPAINNTITTTYTFTPDTGECANPAIITIDVQDLVTPTFNPVADICEGEVLNPLPTTSIEGINGSWTPALNNTTTTTYTFTPNAGECASTQSLTVAVVQAETPTFLPINPICEGDTLNPLPTISLEGITGSWSPALNNLYTTTYTFTPTIGQCASTTALTIQVNSATPLRLFIEVNETGPSRVATVSILPQHDNLEFRWNDGNWQTEPYFDMSGICGQQTIEVRATTGCVSNTVRTFNVFDYPRFFTPNQDGFNDYWQIDCLRNNPTTQTYIFDRFGKLLKQISHDGIGWDGTYAGQPLPSSDYWFKTIYVENGIEKVETGHFSLKR